MSKRVWKKHNGGFYTRRLSLGTEVIYPPLSMSIIKHMVSKESLRFQKKLLAKLMHTTQEELAAKKFINKARDNISTSE